MGSTPGGGLFRRASGERPGERPARPGHRGGGGVLKEMAKIPSKMTKNGENFNGKKDLVGLGENGNILVQLG